MTDEENIQCGEQDGDDRMKPRDFPDNDDKSSEDENFGGRIPSPEKPNIDEVLFDEREGIEYNLPKYQILYYETCLFAKIGDTLQLYMWNWNISIAVHFKANNMLLVSSFFDKM